jgi:hypothetical protein
LCVGIFQVIVIHGETEHSEDALLRTAEAAGLGAVRTGDGAPPGNAAGVAAAAGRQPWVMHRPRLEKWGTHHT